MAHDCPYCGTQSSAFLLLQDFKSEVREHNWFAAVLCGVCKEVALAELIDIEHQRGRSSGQSPVGYSQGNRLLNRYKLVDFEPKPNKPQIAEAIPENVEKPLMEAEKAYAAGLYSAAGSCYRKAIERALKVIDPNLNGMLNARIRTLEKNGMFPHSMVELLDQVRLFGNASMHEDDTDPTKEECSAAREFCNLFLTYSFALPAKVQAAKEKVSNVSPK